MRKKEPAGPAYGMMTCCVTFWAALCRIMIHVEDGHHRGKLKRVTSLAIFTREPKTIPDNSERTK